MTKHVSLIHGNIANSGFFDPIQELLGAAAPNFKVIVKTSTSLEAVAGTENDQAGIAIQGRYRYRTTGVTASLPGGLPDGSHPVYVTASDNDFSGPIEEPDVTVHTFGLEIKESGHTPATAIYRQIGTVTVKSGAITGFEQTVGGVSGARIASGALSNNGDLTWTREQSGAWLPTIMDGAVTSRKLKPTVGVLNATENQTLTTSYVDVAGCKLEITVPVASNVLIAASFLFSITASAEGTVAYGALKVDSETEKSNAATAELGLTAGSQALAANFTAGQYWVVPLAAGAHTLKLRAKKVGSAFVGSLGATPSPNGTQFLYMVFAS